MKFKLVSGTHGTPSGNYVAGDIIETDQDLHAIWDKSSDPSTFRFQPVDDSTPATQPSPYSGQFTG